MATNNTGGPAFPALGRWGNGPAPESALQQDGITTRDYFAAKAMQAILANPTCPKEVDGPDLGKQAYAMADIMLKARSA